jgi:hypothetical protein
MTLIRLIQRASILAGMTFAILPVYGNPAQADTPQFCVVASNGKTACGTLKAVERACVATDAGGVVCGKFKSAKEGQAQGQEARQPSQVTIARKEVENVVFSLKGCRKSDSSIKCEFSILNKGKQRTLRLSAINSTLVDSAGKSHSGKVGDFGAQSSIDPIASVSPEVDYSASITFENIPEQLINAQLLNLYFGLGKTVQFRNIPILN